MITSIATNLIIDKRSIKNDGKFPVKLVVYFNGSNKRYFIKSATYINFL